ncbi:GT2 family glycosyltransferase [Neobacillus niacini]|uniref:glycosyltransferase n=1 Tax=Neobacillus niacini TaxID=86668 RepID=UPI002784529A|nr:glycosyltransferase [Neobacillus niacini]MDQ1000808.1 GT2 family glycosyltransferase [Neobacillus niacini]
MKTTIILVVYKSKLEDSNTYTSLLSVLNNNQSLKKDLSIVIYDNSPEKQELPTNNQALEVSYVHDPRNLGLATAYNFAYQLSLKNKSEWLLLLDHDTTLNEDYVKAILKVDKSIPDQIAAVVPKVVSKNIMISPVTSLSLLPLLEERPTPGLQTSPIMAINSGALIKIDFLKQIGGFTEEFPLDYLDHWLFYKIYNTGHKVLLLDGVELQHELSVMDFGSISSARYRSILDSEIKYYKNYRKELFPAYKKLMVRRLIRQILIEKNKKIAAYTLRRLFSL